MERALVEERVPFFQIPFPSHGTKNLKASNSLWKLMSEQIATYRQV